MSTTTKFLQDIMRQPQELQAAIRILSGSGQAALREAARAIHEARHVYVTGMGSSWHAALNVAAQLNLWGHPASCQDAAELLHFGRIPPSSVVVIISRSGRSAELVELVPKAKRSGATIIAITNTDGELARAAHIPLVIPVKFDHGISVNTYSTLTATAGALASAVEGRFDEAVAGLLSRAVEDAATRLAGWQEQIQHGWVVGGYGKVVDTARQTWDSARRAVQGRELSGSVVFLVVADDLCVGEQASKDDKLAASLLYCHGDPQQREFTIRHSGLSLDTSRARQDIV